MRQDALASWLTHYNTRRPHIALPNRPPALQLGQMLFLGSTAETVPSSRPGSAHHRSSGPVQGSPKATGHRRRAACLRRPAPPVTLAQ